MHLIFRRIGPTLLLLKWAVATPVMAGTAAGTLHVSMTVLASCAASTEPLQGGDSRLPDAISVECPPTYPFRATIARNKATGIMGTDDLAGLQSAGRQTMSVSQLEAGQGHPSSGGPVMLTIAY